MRSDARRFSLDTRGLARNTNPRLLCPFGGVATTPSAPLQSTGVSRFRPRRPRWPLALVALGAAVLSLVAASAAAQGTMGAGAALAVNRADHVSWLGIWARPVSPGAASRYGLETGSSAAVVVRVLPGAAADRNGLRAGDVITAINDLPLDAAHSLRTRIAEVVPTTEVTLSLVRNGNAQTLMVDLLALPSDG